MNDLSFTTFLKICLLGSTQAKAGQIHRLHNGSGGYDFYKRLKLAAQAVAKGDTEPDEILAELKTIKRDAERKHNLQAASEYVAWWKSLEGATPVSPVPKGNYQLPWMAFGIRLVPELRYAVNDEQRVTYLWATALPTLTTQVAALGLLILRERLGNELPPNTKFEIRDLRRKRTISEEAVTNSTKTLLQADLAMVNSLWVGIQPKAA